MSKLMVENIPLWRRVLWSDWSHRLTVLLVGLFLWQFVAWISKEDGLWLPQTIRIVQLTLLATFILEHIPRLHWLVRGFIQLFAVIAINARVLQQYTIIEDVSISSYLSSQLFLNLYELTPYLWFGLSAWVIYLALIWWVEVKWRIYVLLVVSVIAMCVRDSFSNVYLWPQVIVVLGCGLFLLILCHFQRLRLKNPTTWSYLADYPTSLLGPVLIWVSLTLSMGSIMPEVGPLLTDPYTTWRNYQGQPVNFTTGKGVEIAAATATGDASSGYSRNDASLGGGFEFDYTPVMTVETTHRSYWRGETRSLYTGKGWESGAGDRRALVNNVRPDAALATDPRAAGSKLKTIEVSQKVTIMSEDTYPVLFAAFNLQKVAELGGVKTGFEALRWAPTQSELRFNEQQRQPFPKSYSVVSQVPIIDEDGLRQAPAELPNRAEFAEYLELPDSTPSRVRQLAAEITKDALNPYDKAKKLEQYLRETYPYTNKPDLAKGRSRDFVDQFLFEIKEGYCDYFSTAMAVLSRSAGLPARWVKGYATGSTLGSNEYFGIRAELGLQDPDGAGVYTVRNADAHSWVEVYFSGFGWIPFEPTSGFALPRVAQAQEAVTEPTPLPPVPAATEVTAVYANSGSVVGVSGLILLVAALATFLIWKLQVADLVRERLERRRASLLKQKVIVECERMLRIYKQNGYIRDDHETLREATLRWIQQSEWMKADLEQMLSIFEKAKYSNKEITADDWQYTTQLVEKLRSRL